MTIAIRCGLAPFVLAAGLGVTARAEAQMPHQTNIHPHHVLAQPSRHRRLYPASYHSGGAMSDRYAAGPIPAGAMAVGTQRPTHDVLLSIGEGELVTLPVPVASVWTSNPEVADVYVSNSRQIHLFGKTSGEATVFAATGSGAVAYAAKIRVSQNISSLGKLLKLAMPDAEVTVTIIGQFAMLTGTVASPEDSAEAAKLVLVALNPGMKPGDADTAKIGIINRIRTAVPLQVNLQVRIAEVSRSLARTLGSNLATITQGGGGFQFGVGQGRSGFYNTFFPGQPLSTTGSVNTPIYAPGCSAATCAPIFQNPGTSVNPNSGSTTLALAGKLLGINVLAALDLGETVGLVTTLAQPNLTAVSGETAEFLVGGEFPIPISQGLGAVSVDYKKYGVSLSYTPTVLADGRISLRVRPEVSELSAQGAVTLSGFTVPALTVRRAETTVELGSGQSFMIAGLLSNNASHTIQKLPGAGDLPILGALFKSTNFQKSETELVIVITPYLVMPVDDRDIKLPTDAVKSPTIIQQVLGNMVSDGASDSTRPLPTGVPIGAPAASPATRTNPAPTPTPKVGERKATSGRPAMAAITGSALSDTPGAAPGFNLN